MVLTFHGCTFEVLIFRFLMTSKRRILVRKREFRGDSLFILDLVLHNCTFGGNPNRSKVIFDGFKICRGSWLISVYIRHLSPLGPESVTTNLIRD